MESDASRADAPGAAVRAGLSHPVIDGDGHLIEAMPLFHEYLVEVGGDSLARDFETLQREKRPFGLGDAARGEPRAGWWGVSNNALDVATVTIPALLAERLDELGIDFAVLYPSIGLTISTLPKQAVRRGSCRALNRMNSELCSEHAARLTPAAAIPMHTPDEAVEELRFAVTELGFKVASIPPVVARPLPAHADAFPAACSLDRFGLDSEHDYDPVWRACLELGVAVTSHGAVAMRYMPDGRSSPTNYMFNHIGGHAYQQSELAKSLIMGGVPMRFPRLRFGFLECGVGWAPDLLHSLEEHWEKRSGDHLFRAYDPSRLDRAEFEALLERYGFPSCDPIGSVGQQRDPWVRDEFEESGIRDAQQLREMFERQFFFGCEADDVGIYRAFHAPGNPFGIRLQAVFSSDIGHWDVPDLRRVLPASRELFERGLLPEDDYRAFVFENPARLHLEMNPHFFDGTCVEDAVRELRSG